MVDFTTAQDALESKVASDAHETTAWARLGERFRSAVGRGSDYVTTVASELSATAGELTELISDSLPDMSKYRGFGVAVTLAAAATVATGCQTDQISRERLAEMGLESLGLEAAFPEGVDCPQVLSGFTSRRNTDGSLRPTDYLHGIHNGIDIGAPRGTEVLAPASGEVLAVYPANDGINESIAIMHSPAQGFNAADTLYNAESGEFTYSVLTHLDVTAEKGDIVNAGDVIGTIGYKETRYHVHHHVLAGFGGNEELKSGGFTAGHKWMSPLWFYADTRWPPADKKADIAYINQDGEKHPASARVVWPLRCVDQRSNLGQAIPMDNPVTDNGPAYISPIAPGNTSSS